MVTQTNRQTDRANIEQSSFSKVRKLKKAEICNTLQALLYSYSNSCVAVFKIATDVYEAGLDSTRSQQQNMLSWLSKVRPGTWRYTYDLLLDSITPPDVFIASDAFPGFLASYKAKDPTQQKS